MRARRNGVGVWAAALIAMPLRCAGDLRAPGAPTDAILEVVSGDALEISWNPPATDGGAVVQSYQAHFRRLVPPYPTSHTLRRDTGITTSTYIGANELQTIQTTADDIDEVQEISTKASAVREVQTVTATAPVGGTLAGTFSLALDTRSTGGSLQYSGAISADADACCGRLSVSTILEALQNVGSGGIDNVTRVDVEFDGHVGYMWTVTFAATLSDVPQLQLLDASGLTLGSTVTLATLVEGNVISGTFRLTFMGDTTASIPSDATAAQVEKALEALDSVTDVVVERRYPQAFGGYTWLVTFTHDDNGGDIPLIEAIYDETLVGKSADPYITVNATDGNELSGSFNISFANGTTSARVAYDASAADMISSLESLDEIPAGTVAVSRSGPDFERGYTWTVSFLDDINRTFEGDVQLISLASTDFLYGEGADVTVTELRKGTIKEVQLLNVTSTSPSPAVFHLNFRGATTGAIRAGPNYNGACAKETWEVQRLSSTTNDMTSEGGDATVSPRTTFRLTFGDAVTDYIYANPSIGDCTPVASAIKEELEAFSTIYQVRVSSSSTIASEECDWDITFISESGNLDPLTVAASYDAAGAEDGPSSSASIGDDTLTVTTLVNGDADIIETELEALTTIGRVTVSNVDEGAPSQVCLYRITFDTNAGTVPLLKVTNNTWDLSGTTSYADENVTVMVSRLINSTSTAVSGDYTLEFRGQRTGYLISDSSAYEVERALESLSTIGNVAVTRTGLDENGGATWSITFLTELGDVPMLITDDLDLSGTAVTATSYLVTQGVFPPFDSLDEANGLPLGSAAITDLADLRLHVTGLERNIPYYFRIIAVNAIGQGPAGVPSPPYEAPVPKQPSSPTNVSLTVLGATSLRVRFQSPLSDGGESLDAYKVEYADEAFADEIQAVRISVNTSMEIQEVYTNVTDVNEVQLIHAKLADDYAGRQAYEYQILECDATGGSFTLTFDGLTTRSIDYDASASTLKAALEELTNVNSVNVVFFGVGLLMDNDVSTVCVDGGSSRASYTDAGSSATAGANITFSSVDGYKGDVPELVPNTNNLDGLRRVTITEEDGDWGLGGTFRLTFRGATTNELTPLASASDIETELVALDTIQAGGVVVSKLSATMMNPYNLTENLWAVTFVGSGVGGDVESLSFKSYDNKLTGTGAALKIYADGEESSGNRRGATTGSNAGNQLGGTFTLTLRGHTTDPIEYNAAASTMKARLEGMPNIGVVDVTRSAPGPRREYSWKISFVANPGYFPPESRNVDLLYGDASELTGLGAVVLATTIQQGSDPLKGSFQLQFCNSSYAHATCATTDAIESDLLAAEFEVLLEALDSVGDIAVSRVTNFDGYTWYVTFGGCGVADGGNDVCNNGDVAPLIWVTENSTLTGGGSKPNVTITEVEKGVGPSNDCDDNIEEGGTCQAHKPITKLDITGNDLYAHDIVDIATGERTYARVRFHNNEGFGPYSLTQPEYEIPSYNAPGACPPVRLVSSTATSISVEWDRPTVDGGSPVMGYELWMDDWSGGNPRMVFDGSDQPDTTEFTIRTSTSIGVESGRQYRFTVRAVNFCSARDTDLLCYGAFSPHAVFTVRAPRTPLPPRAPYGGSASGIGSVLPGDASIDVRWNAPDDNGGANITEYQLWMAQPGREFQKVQLTGPLFDRLPGRSLLMRHVVEGLDEGEMYRFYVQAVNSKGRSAKSPLMSTLAATVPGRDATLNHTYAWYRPKTIDVGETSIHVKWQAPALNSTGGSAIVGYKLYMYPGVALNTVADPDPVKQEVQRVVVTSKVPTDEQQRLLFANVDSDASTVRLKVDGNWTVSLKPGANNNVWAAAIQSALGCTSCVRVEGQSGLKLGK